jgi:hypothetical protein
MERYGNYGHMGHQILKLFYIRRAKIADANKLTYGIQIWVFIIYHLCTAPR